MSVRKSILLGALSVLWLAGCGSDSGVEDAAKQAQAKPVKRIVVPVDPLASMARAVGNGKPGAAVDLRYDLLQRPEAGKPLQLQVALVPGPGVDGMEVTFSGMDGISLSGELTASFAGVKSGEAYKHTLSVLPDRNGVFYVTASINAQVGGAMAGRTYSIPFVVGADTPVQKKAAVAATDATGQPVEVMKAEENAH